MDIQEILMWFKGCFTGKYAVFEGRARRKEFFAFALVNAAISIALKLLTAIFFPFAVLAIVYAIAAFVPAIAVTARRLHDTGRSGWWQLLYLIPPAGIVVIVFLCLKGDPADNAFGADPRYVLR